MLPSFLTPGSSLLHRKDSTQLPTFPRRLLQDRIFTLSPKKERPKKRDFVYSLSVELTTAASSVLAFDCKQYTGTANPSDFQCKTYAQHRDFSTPRYILRSAIRFGWHHSKAILFCCRVFFSLSICLFRGICESTRLLPPPSKFFLSVCCAFYQQSERSRSLEKR